MECCRRIIISPGGSTLGVFIIFFFFGGGGVYELVVEKSLRYRHFGTAVLTYNNYSRYVLLMKSHLQLRDTRIYLLLKYIA